jgi:hypothetical protein
MRDRLQQELCQADFGRKRVTKLQSRLTFCHGRLFFSHFCCMDRKNVLHLHSERPEDGHTVDVAQLVRASDCGSEGRGFEPLLPPEEVSSKRGDLFFLRRYGHAGSEASTHAAPYTCPIPRQVSAPPAAARGCRQPHSPASARQQPNLPTYAAIDSRAARRFSLLPPDRRASARRQTSLPPHRRSADSKAVRRAPLHFPLRHNRPIFRNRHYPHKHLNLRNRHRPRPSASKRQKKQPSPRWGRLSSLCSNRLRGRSHGAEARS